MGFAESRRQGLQNHGAFPLILALNRIDVSRLLFMRKNPLEKEQRSNPIVRRRKILLVAL